MEVKSLIELEKLDIEIARLEKSKKSYPLEVDEMETRLKELKDVLDKAESKLDTCEREKAHASNEYSSNKSELERSHEKLNAVNTEREYDAMLLEISERKAMIEKASKKIKKCADDIVSLTEDVTTAKTEYDSLVSELQPKIDDLKEKIGSIDTDIVAVVEKRPSVESEVPESFLRSYKNILKNRKNGRSLSIVKKDTVTCGYCYQLLTPNAVKNAKESETPVFCENCGSIFVWED